MIRKSCEKIVYVKNEMKKKECSLFYTNFKSFIFSFSPSLYSTKLTNQIYRKLLKNTYGDGRIHELLLFVVGGDGGKYDGC
jgi:hypothetical protein